MPNQTEMGILSVIAGSTESQIAVLPLKTLLVPVLPLTKKSTGEEIVHPCLNPRPEYVSGSSPG